MHVLVLEDDPRRIFQFKQRFLERGWCGTFVTTASEAINQLSNKQPPFALVFLDHDLDGEVYRSCLHHNTGSEVARWLAKQQRAGRSLPKIVIHSHNEGCALYMKAMVKGSELHPTIWMQPNFDALFPLMVETP